MSRIRVFIVEDDSLLRESLTMLVGLGDEIQAVGSAPNGEIALSELGRIKADVILTDLEMPRMDGIEFTLKVRKLLPDVPVVVLTKFGDDDRLFSAIKSGAIGYLLKDSGVEEIKSAIRDAAEGHGRLSPALVTRVLAEFGRLQHRTKETQELFSELTRREMEVLELLGKGLRNRAIADSFEPEREDGQGPCRRNPQKAPPPRPNRGRPFGPEARTSGTVANPLGALCDRS